MLILSAFALGLLVSFSPLGRIFRRHPGLPILLGILTLTMLATVGCTATWLSLLSAALPSIATLVQAIAAFIAGLSGKTVSTAVETFVNKVVQDIAGQIQNIQDLIAAATGAATSGLAAQIGAVLSAIVTNLNSLLTDAGITDSATLSKYGMIIALAIGAVQAALAFIPMLATPVGAAVKVSDEELKALEAHKDAYKGQYKAWLKTKTGSAVVDAAVAEVGKQYPSI